MSKTRVKIENEIVGWPHVTDRLYYILLQLGNTLDVSVQHGTRCWL